MEHFAEFQVQAVAVVQAWLELHRSEILPTDLEVAASVLVMAAETVTHAPYAPPFSHLDRGAVQEELVALINRYLTGTETP